MNRFRHAPLLLGLLFFVPCVLLLGPAHAAQQPLPDGVHWIDVEQGQSLIWNGERPISRVLVSNPAVAEVKLLERQQFQIRGVQVGTTDLWIWYAASPDQPVSFEISVHQDLSELNRRISEAVEGTPPRVYPLKGRLVVDGVVPDVETLERVAAMARIYDPDFVDLLAVQGDHQVQLHVVFAEVSRTGIRELGFNALLWGDDVQAGWYGQNYGDVADLGSGSFGYSQSVKTDTLNWLYPTTGAFQLLGAVTVDPGILGILLGALEENSLTKVLAEPTLVALSGQQAEFLAGGEVPIAITTYDRIDIEFKEYGVKLVFVPTVLAGDVIDLRVYTEVSELDESASIEAGGLAIPGFITRKGSSHLRIENGMTFAMAGLLGEQVAYTRAGIPLLSQIPILGAIFRYTKHTREETEVMIFVTPKLVRPLAPGEIPPLPTATQDNNPGDFALFLLGMDHVPGSRGASATGPIGMER